MDTTTRRVPIPIPEGFQELADASDRSVANLAKLVLKEHVRKQKGNSYQRRIQRRKQK